MMELIADIGVLIAALLVLTVYFGGFLDDDK